MERNAAKEVGNSIAIEEECEAWDWARASGVSSEDLRKAVREWLGNGKDSRTPA